jgi:hypothetical protein
MSSTALLANRTPIRHDGSMGPENFLNELLAPLGPPERESIIAGHLGHLRPVQDELGRIYGRAALWMEGGPAQERHEMRTRPHPYVAVGGFVNASAEGPFRYVGVLSGDTQDIARSGAQVKVPDDALARWASDQAGRLSKENFTYMIY